MRGRNRGSAHPHCPHSAAPHSPARAGRPDEVHLDQMAPDPFARLTLALLRWHFQNFARPDSHSWLTALRLASAQVGSRRAGGLCFDIVAIVQTLRMARATPVSFNSEACACCRVWLTPDERRLLELLEALRRGQHGQAHIIAQLLCDGVPDTALLSGMQVLLTHHAYPGSVFDPTIDPTKGDVT
ncbi:hypothetical protein [Roseinatronobacter alkalisoli]|uniref:Uncharacterized protein n=1 Tax=Roseinatronobacter alkalisoli TaxID=3028235 RepID=A0ABT5T8T8_9RHOB|nr:hypothetical protein [Roseinatronobacter sp. HJB301]MDD7971374.1 hypothetical protein [Roseinatronobacter sp. HJB301]